MITLVELTDRQMFIVRALISYATSNTDDVNEAFASSSRSIAVGPQVGKHITTDELDELNDEFREN